MLGIYQLGVSPTWINPASPGWSAVVVKALPAGRPRELTTKEADAGKEKPKAEAHGANKPNAEGGRLGG